jgi:peptidoglycan hydrolase-like protein with peptidoglycan-binding domain
MAMFRPLRPIVMVLLALPVLLSGCLALQEKPAPVAAGPSIPVEQAQAGLYALGYRPGPVDGILGPRTRDAVIRFREAEGLPPGDELDREFADRMAERLAFVGYERRRRAAARPTAVAKADSRAGQQVDTDLRSFLADWEQRSASTGTPPAE